MKEKFDKKYLFNFLLIVTLGALLNSRAYEIPLENKGNWRIEEKDFTNSNWEILSDEENRDLLRDNPNKTINKTKKKLESKFKTLGYK